jgi:hypothetical protein
MIPEETNQQTSGTNNTTSGVIQDAGQNMIQDINRDNNTGTTLPLPEIPTLPSGATQVPTIPGF